MKTISISSLTALIFGLAAFFAIHWLWPAIAIENFANVIGLVAVLGAAIGAWWSRSHAMSAPSKPVQDSSNDEMDPP